MLLYLYLLGVLTPQSSSLFVGNRVEDQHVCQTEDCKKSAKRILDYMEPAVQPCDDFYQFSCGTFINAPGLIDYESNLSLSQLKKVVQDQLLGIILSDPEPNETRAHQILRNFTTLCMTWDIWDAREVAQRLSVLERAGGWPVLGNWKSESWSLLETIIKLRHLGLEADSLFSIHVAPDPRNPSRAVFHIDQPTLRLSQNKDKMLKAAIMLGADPETAENQLADAILFERELDKISAPDSSRQDHHLLYIPHTQDELMDQFGWLDWSQLLTLILPRDINPSIMKGKPVIIKSVDYLRKLEYVLQKHQTLYSNEIITTYRW